jgi:carbon monoxide dehydrogenase subunit G
MRALVRREVRIAAPPDVVWDYVTDWPKQGEWIPRTRVERVDPGDPARRVGGRFRAWSGLGRLGFWDTITVTSWEQTTQGGRCEVLHTGAVVRGEGEFSVVPDGRDASRFTVKEMVVVPGGRVGALGWKVARPVVERLLDASLRTLRTRLELMTRAGG